MMNPSGSQNSSIPPWLRDESLEDARSTPMQPGANGYSAVPGVQPTVNPALLQRAKTIHWGLKVATMLLCLLMSATAVIGLENINGVDSSGKIFVATYMFFFSVLLFTFELMEIRRVEWIDFFYRRNFGFLYNILGRALFVIFIAFLSFGLGDPETLTYGTGFVVALFGGFEIALYLKYPEVFELQQQQ